jgi:methyl-accepting chemotaxis protein
MRPVPQSLLLALLIALCALCAWQWWRESALREMAIAQRGEVFRIAAERDDLASRMKAADAEILRLTAALTDLRSHSVSKQVYDEMVQSGQRLRDTAEKQNVTIKDQNESITKQNAAVQQANQNIRKLTTERDDLARRVNDMTALYNKLAQERK